MLNGMKTKLAIIGAFMYAIGGLITGNLDANTALQVMIAAFGAYGIYEKIDRG